MILLDIEKACGTVWINGFLHKLTSPHLRDYLSFLKFCLEVRTFTVNLNDSTCTPKPTPPVVVLSTTPTLFSVYLSHIRRPPHTHLVLYADNIALLSQSWRPDTVSPRLSHAVSTLLKYFTTWKLRLNAYKTKTILFSKRPLQIRDTFVPWVLSSTLFIP